MDVAWSKPHAEVKCQVGIPGRIARLAMLREPQKYNAGEDSIVRSEKQPFSYMRGRVMEDITHSVATLPSALMVW